MFDVELAKKILDDANEHGWIDLTAMPPDEEEFNCIIDALRIAVDTESKEEWVDTFIPDYFGDCKHTKARYSEGRHTQWSRRTDREV